MNDIRSQLEDTLDAGFNVDTLKTVRKQFLDLTCEMFSAAYLSDVSRCKRNVSAELLKRVLSLGQQVK